MQSPVQSRQGLDESSLMYVGGMRCNILWKLCEQKNRAGDGLGENGVVKKRAYPGIHIS